MQQIGVREFQQRIRQTLEDSTGEPVVITRHGRPAGLLLGVKGLTWDALVALVDRLDLPAPTPDSGAPSPPPAAEPPREPPRHPPDEWRSW